MSTLVEPVDAPAADTVALPALHPVRPFAWSVRREIWEHRSLWAAPAIAAGVVLFAFFVSVGRLGWLFRNVDLSDPAHQAAVSMIPFSITAFVILITMVVVAVFYCLGALHNERRDRSILFWKSLPVSDLKTVLAKAAIPMVALPVICLALVLATEAIVGLVASAVFAAHHVSPAVLWTVSPLEQAGYLVWGVFALTLWHAPAYAWLMLAGAWAKRAPFLWAFGLPIAAGIFELIAFNTHFVGDFFWRRLLGGFTEAFGETSIGPHQVRLPRVDVVGFFGNPALWVGRVVAAALLGGCVWLRRYREPV